MVKTIRQIALCAILTLFLGCSNDDLSFDGLIPVSSSQKLVGWGDSMMFGTGGSRSILKVMSDELSNIPFKNFGVGGLKSENVVLLQGGLPLNVSLENNEIPSSGVVDIPVPTIEPFNNQLQQFRFGKIGDVPGKLIRVPDQNDPTMATKYQFERVANGEAISIDDQATFIFEDAVKNRDGFIIIWVGRNDPKDEEGIQNTVTNLLAMVNYLDDFAKEHYLIISVCNGIADSEGIGTDSYNRIQNLNSALANTFQDRFIDLRTYMTEQAIFDLNISPSEMDLNDMSLDCIPRSLLSDHVHFNSLGYEAAGKYLANIIKSLNWPLN